MKHKLEATVLQVGGQLIEGYERETKASPEKLRDLGLEIGEINKSQIGTALVEEFLVLQANNILQNNTVSWNLERIGQDVKIESLFVDSPNSDALTFELFNGDSKIFNFQLNRNKTPYDFPEAPLSPNLRIQIKAKSKIDLLRIVLKPVVILETFLPDEQLINERGRDAREPNAREV